MPFIKKTIIIIILRWLINNKRLVNLDHYTFCSFDRYKLPQFFGFHRFLIISDQVTFFIFVKFLAEFLDSSRSQGPLSND